MNDVGYDWIEEKRRKGYVVVDGDNIEAAIRESKQKTQKSGILIELRKKEFALSKTERRKQKNRLAARRTKRRQRRREDLTY